jgi:HEAT repeats
MAATKTPMKPRDEVDRAVEGLGRATQKLIALLASEDEAVGQKALSTLVRRLHPPAAVSYLGESLGRSKGDTRLRRRVASALAAIGRQVREPATTTLIACLLDERDESFAGHLLACLSGLGPAPGGPG